MERSPHGLTKLRHTIAGKPVYLARGKLDFTITAENVKKGARRSEADCAAALGIMDCIPGAIGARVHIGRTYVEFKRHWEMWDTPNCLKHEVVAHDRDGKFMPGDNYYLQPVSPSERAKFGRRAGSNKPGARDKGSKDRTPKRPRAKPHIIQGIRARGANV